MCCQTQSQWEEWYAWGDCSQKCGGGTQTRTRICDNSFPGNDCELISKILIDF